MALLNVRLGKLLVGFFASVSVAAPVAYMTQDYFVSNPASTFSISSIQAVAGSPIAFIVTRTSGSGHAVLTFTTHDVSAISGKDYVLTVKSVNFGRTQRTSTILIPTFVDPSATGSLTFTGSIQYNGQITSSTATITKGTVVTTPPPPATQVCSDGSTILATATCPPPPAPSYVVSPTLDGLADIPDNFDYNTAIEPGLIPGSDGPDQPGAFRFICEFDKLLPDDPVVYPGQPGKSHVHNFYGNESVNAGSTFNILRTTGGSSCNHFGDGTTAANRSGYWIPAMDDGKGHYVQPDYAALYYKRLPNTDPILSDPLNAKYEGQAEPIPNGLRYIFGYNMATGTNPHPSSMWFNCQGPTATPGHYVDIPTAAANCPTGNQLGFIIEAPSCWDGLYVDTPDHRSHMSYPDYGYWGYLKCDAGHPYVIPTLTLGTWYTVSAGDDLTLWHFSSDEMHPELTHGSTGHADYFEAWSRPVKMMWENNCINKRLSCTGGNLGNGFGLKGAATPTYIINGVTINSWTNPNRLVNK